MIPGLFKKAVPYLFILPVTLFSGLFLYYCVGFTFVSGLFKWDGMGAFSRFVALRNYLRLLEDPLFRMAVRNTLIFIVATVTLQMSVGSILAVFLRGQPRGKSLYRILFFMPMALAPVIVAAIFRVILNPDFGAVNETLRFLRLDALTRAWLGHGKLALASVVVVNVFQYMGFSMILYLSALESIPAELYEAAALDGAGFWRTLFRVTLPLVRRTTGALIFLNVIMGLKTFDIIVLLTNGGPGGSTETLTTYLYKQMFDRFNGGMAGAVGVSIILLAVILTSVERAILRGRRRA